MELRDKVWLRGQICFLKTLLLNLASLLFGLNRSLNGLGGHGKQGMFILPFMQHILGDCSLNLRALQKGDSLSVGLMLSK